MILLKRWVLLYSLNISIIIVSYSQFPYRYALIRRTFVVYLHKKQLKLINMDKKKEQAILKLNKIKGWANDIIMRSKKMEQLLESINKTNPDIQDLTMFIDIGDARYGAEMLLANIEEAIDDIERK